MNSNNVSLDSVMSLVGCMANERKSDDLKSASDGAKEVSQTQAKTRQELKASKDELKKHQDDLRDATDGGVSDFFGNIALGLSPFSTNPEVEANEGIGTKSIDIQNAQAELSKEQTKLEQLQQKFKDSLEDFSASKQVVDDVRKELEKLGSISENI